MAPYKSTLPDESLLPERSILHSVWDIGFSQNRAHLAFVRLKGDNAKKKLTTTQNAMFFQTFHSQSTIRLILFFRA